MSTGKSDTTNTPVLRYRCPGCLSALAVHDTPCEYEGASREVVERAYIDILSALAVSPQSESEIADLIDAEWADIHDGVVSRLIRNGELTRRPDGRLRLSEGDDDAGVSRREVPNREPLEYIYHHGTYPGCHDNGLCAMIAWWSFQEYSWEETKSLATDWLRSSGSWDRGGWAESQPEDVVAKKHHIWEEGYGWTEFGTSAKRVIQAKRSG